MALRCVCALVVCVLVYSAYPFLVRLHCLRELEKSVSLASQKSESAKLAMLQQWDWDGRLSAVTPSRRCDCVASALFVGVHVGGMANSQTEQAQRVWSWNCTHAAVLRTCPLSHSHTS